MTQPRCDCIGTLSELQSARLVGVTDDQWTDMSSIHVALCRLLAMQADRPGSPTKLHCSCSVCRHLSYSAQSSHAPACRCRCCCCSGIPFGASPTTAGSAGIRLANAVFTFLAALSRAICLCTVFQLEGLSGVISSSLSVKSSFGCVDAFSWRLSHGQCTGTRWSGAWQDG
jgi:hypothetical protein